MQITDKLWDEIVADTTARIEKLQQSANEHGRPDTFHVAVTSLGGGYTVLLTRQVDGQYETDAHAVARTSDGHLRPARPKRPDRHGRRQITISGTVPKAWAGLANKPAKEIVTKLKLCDFLLMLSSRMTGVRVGTTFRGYDIAQGKDGYVIKKDDEVVCSQPSEELAREWVNQERDKARPAAE